MTAQKYNTNDIIRRTVTEMLLNTHTCIPAIVESFNSATQTVNVRVAVKTPTFNKGTIEESTIEDVPVLFPSGSDWVIAGTLVAGDSVMLLAPHYGIDEYMQGSKGEVGVPRTVRHHSLDEAVAITGMFTFSEPTRKESLQSQFHIAQGENNFISMDDSTGVTIQSGASIINLNNGNITVTGVFTINGIPFGTHTHTHAHNDGTSITSPPITP